MVSSRSGEQFASEWIGTENPSAKIFLCFFYASHKLSFQVCLIIFSRLFQSFNKAIMFLEFNWLPRNGGAC